MEQKAEMKLIAHRINPRSFRTELNQPEDSAPILGRQYWDLFAKFTCKGDVSIFFRTQLLQKPAKKMCQPCFQN